MATKIKPQDVDTTQTFVLSSSQFSDGSAAAPSMTFSSDATTGLFKGGTTTLSITTAGVEQWRVGGNGNLQSQGTGTLRTSDGSTSAPSLSFRNETNSGFYRSAANSVALSLGGTTHYFFDANAFQPWSSVEELGSTGQAWHRLYTQDGSAALPVITFGTDTDTGIFHSGTNSLGLTVGGTQIIEFDPGVITPGSDNTVALGSTALGWTRLFMKAGSSGSPSYTFRDFSNYGFYVPTTNAIGVTVTGNNTATFYSSSLNSSKRGVLYLNDLANEDGTSLFLGFGERTLTYSGNEVGWLDLSKGDAAGTYLGAHNQIRFMAGANIQASTSYTSKDNTGRYFVLSPNPFSDDLQPIPGRTFTIGANTYTVRQYRNANNRLFVYEDISVEAASGTLINVTYASVSMMAAANQIRVQDGSAAGPSYSYLNDTTTGWHRTSAGTIRYSSSGSDVVVLEPSDLRMINGCPIYASTANTASAPAYSFISNTGTGMYMRSSTQVGFAASGNEIAYFTYNPGNAYSLTMNATVTGGPHLVWAGSNTATGSNPNASTLCAMGVNDGNQGDVYQIYSIGGPTTYWSTGIDNSVSDQFCISVTPGAGTASPGTGDVVQISTTGQIKMGGGSAAAPGLAFLTQTNLGFARTGTNQVSICAGGASVADFGVSGSNYVGLNGAITPNTDNAYSNGANGLRWTAVWAVNGTIQTSHSSTKEVLGTISEDTPIPDGILFKRPGSDKIHVGFLADNLPKEAFYEDGVSIETSAPIGVLCVKLKQAFREIESLKAEMKKLKGE